MAKRDYQRELAKEKKNHPERGQERSDRNKARRVMVAAVGKKALKGKEVDHRNGSIDGKPKVSDLRIVTPRANNNGRRGGPATMKGKKGR